MVESEVKEEYQKVKAEGKQSLCPHCKTALQIRQTIFAHLKWRWEEKAKTFIGVTYGVDENEPFCMKCKAKD